MRTITSFGDRKLRLCCHPRWLALEVRVAIVSYISCGSTRPFSHGKGRLYPWEVCVLRVTSIPTVKLPMGNHYMDTSKRTKELPMTFPEPSRRV